MIGFISFGCSSWEIRIDFYLPIIHLLFSVNFYMYCAGTTLHFIVVNVARTLNTYFTTNLKWSCLFRSLPELLQIIIINQEIHHFQCYSFLHTFYNPLFLFFRISIKHDLFIVLQVSMSGHCLGQPEGPVKLTMQDPAYCATILSTTHLTVCFHRDPTSLCDLIPSEGHPNTAILYVTILLYSVLVPIVQHSHNPEHENPKKDSPTQKRVRTVCLRDKSVNELSFKVDFWKYYSS